MFCSGGGGGLIDEPETLLVMFVADAVTNTSCFYHLFESPFDTRPARVCPTAYELRYDSCTLIVCMQFS